MIYTVVFTPEAEEQLAALYMLKMRRASIAMSLTRSSSQDPAAKF